MDFKALKELVWDSGEPDVAPPPPSPTAGTVAVPAPMNVTRVATYMVNPEPVSTVGANTDKAYDVLAASTDPSGTDNLGRILTLAKPLEGVITDRTQRFRAAAAQAQSMGVTPNSVSDDLIGLLKTLEDHDKKFAASAQEHRRTDVDEREKTATDLEAEINAKQIDLRALRTKIESTKAEIAHTETVFAGAMARRRAELEQLRAEFTAILK